MSQPVKDFEFASVPSGTTNGVSVTVLAAPSQEAAQKPAKVDSATGAGVSAQVKSLGLPAQACNW